MRTDENEFYRQAVSLICSSLDIETAMRRCYRYISGILPADLLTLGIYEPGLSSLRIAVMAGPSGSSAPDLIIHLTQKLQQIMIGMDPARVHIFNEPDQDQLSVHITKELGAPPLSGMLLLAEAEGEILGGVRLSAEGENRYSEEHAHLFSLLNKPFAMAISNCRHQQEAVRLRKIVAEDKQSSQSDIRYQAGERIVGEDFGLREVMDLVFQAAALDTPVLLEGEIGVGKSLIASAIHQASSLRERPFIRVSCGVVHEKKLTSEFDAEENGAPGPASLGRGLFERATHGTVFFDEIDALSPADQERVLNFLQRKQIGNSGATRRLGAGVRVICATHQDLEEMVESGIFMEELWQVLKVIHIRIPPLRERKADIPSLVHHFIRQKSIEIRMPIPPFLTLGAVERLMEYSWPGNVRELENVVERALILNRGEPLSFDRVMLDYPERNPWIGAPDEHGSLRVEDVLASHLRQVLKMTNGKISGPGGAAELLDINASTLRSRLEKLGIPYKKREKST